MEVAGTCVLNGGDLSSEVSTFGLRGRLGSKKLYVCTGVMLRGQRLLSVLGPFTARVPTPCRGKVFCNYSDH